MTHAEMEAMMEIQSFLVDHGRECTIYTTIEPCPMCLGSIVMNNRDAELIFQHTGGGGKIMKVKYFFFKHNIRIYEVYNSGWWYDLGYYIAVISGFGGISLFRGKKQNND